MIFGCASFLGPSGFRGEDFLKVSVVSLDGLKEGDTSNDDEVLDTVVDILSGLAKVFPEIPSSFVGLSESLFVICAVTLDGLEEGDASEAVLDTVADLFFGLSNVFPETPSKFVGLLELLFTFFVVSRGGLEEKDTSGDASDIVLGKDSDLTIVFLEFPSRFACVFELLADVTSA